MGAIHLSTPGADCDPAGLNPKPTLATACFVRPGANGPKKQIFGVVKQVFGRKQSDKDVFSPTSVQSGEGRTDFSLRSANLPRPVNGWGLFRRLELQIDHFVMAITSVGAKVWHTAQVA